VSNIEISSRYDDFCLSKWLANLMIHFYISVIMDSVEAYSLYSTFLSKESPCSIKVPRKLSLSSMEQVLKKATAVGTSKA